MNEYSIKSIAMRADMDALTIPENNPHLNYKS
jgi:metal-dependent amidase/aminoacylase/carboxypeptidase family protein